ncbi:MAG: hypothetical protein HY553_13915 [Elusimicrobia bacterium]|nr:hypothetical protein [Elusimicrobiota bacterium]
MLYTKLKRGKQTSFPVWQNVYLIQASTPAAALKKAARLGRANSGDSGGSYTYGNEPARIVFGGVRSVIECDNSAARPRDGTEVSYLELEVRGLQALKRLISDETVQIVYKGRRRP